MVGVSDHPLRQGRLALFRAVSAKLKVVDGEVTMSTPLNRRQRGRIDARAVRVNQTYLRKLEKGCPATPAGAIARDTGTASNIAVGRRAVIMSLRRPPAVGPKGEARGLLDFG
jgi:hypothetical protein